MTVVLTGSDHLYHIGIDAVVAECSTCGLWFQRPRLPRGMHTILYPPDYGPHGSGQVGSEPRMNPIMLDYLGRALGYSHINASAYGRVGRLIPEKLLRWRADTALIPNFVRDGRILDVGCGSGDMLRVLKALGWKDLQGIEPDATAADAARATGAIISCGPVEDVLPTIADGSLDVVIASMVLEHLVDPFETVGIIASKLTPGGELLLSTISRDSFDARLYREHWAGFDFPRHMVYFRKEDIAAMLAPTFRDVRWSYQVAPIDWIRSASWRRRSIVDRVVAAMGERPLLLLGLLSAGLGRSTRVSIRCRMSTAGPASA